MGTETPSRTRRLLTFRLDGELRQRLKARLAGEGRTMSEVVILGLQMYVQRSAWLAGPGTLERAPETDAPLLVPEVMQVAESAEVLAGGELSAVASVTDLVLPDQVTAYLRDLRASGHSDELSAALAKLHDAGWPLRPMAVALGISRQAVQARIRQHVAPQLRSQVPDMPPPSAFPRRRPALASGRRPHLTVKIDHALRSAAQSKAIREGNSLSQVIEKILDHYLRHGMPSGEVRLGDTTPTRPARPARRRKRRT